MSRNLKLLESITREIMPSEEEIARRKEFLEFSRSDLDRLREFHEHLKDLHAGEAFSDLFYGHLRAYPELHEFIPDEAAVERLKVIQTEYFLRLTAGDYGEDYVRDRLKVGFAHQRIGMDSKWYTGGYRKYLSFLLSTLCKLSEPGGTDCEFAATFDALLKVVFFDMELALDTYFHSARKELLHMASHDALTGLPNRILLNDRIDQAIHHAHRTEDSVAILFIDLDRFKNINDSLGHQTGDQVISAVAATLLGSLREGDTVARLGGDEFVVVLDGIEQQESIAAIAEKLLCGIEQSVVVDSHELFVTASLGIAVFPMDGGTRDELLKNADTAMYQAKQEGCGRFRFYQQEMNLYSLERLKLETMLRHALERHEFLLHYQPQVDMSNGRIVGVEALIRWQSDDDLFLPAKFIQLAEETGMIVPIGEWALATACRQAVAWHRAGVSALFRVAVNLSARQFRGNDIAGTVSRILQETGCRAEWLELEITESIIMEQPEEAAKTLKTLSGMGVTIALDDFGTGYSSLAYLKRFPIQNLKIDRSFVLSIASDNDDVSIVRAVIALAHNLNLRVTGEGIECSTQFNYLRNLGCDFAQGNLFSRPLSADELAPLLFQETAWISPDGQLRQDMRATIAPQGVSNYDAIELHDCRVLRLRCQAVCLASKDHCSYVNPLGNLCGHPLVDQIEDADMDY